MTRKEKIEGQYTEIVIPPLRSSAGTWHFDSLADNASKAPPLGIWDGELCQGFVNSSGVACPV